MSTSSMAWEPDIEIRVGREGTRWFAVGCLETPHGPMVLSSVGDEEPIFERLIQRYQRTQPTVGFSLKGISKKFRKIARSVARSSVVKNIKAQVKKIAKNPIVATAIKLHTDALKLAKHALKGVTNNPLWDIVATGASFIPGIGSAVSAGMAAAAAIGRGASLKDAAIAAVKNALPGGPVAAAAFDIAVGVAHGDRIDQIALNTVRNQLPGGALGKAAFDAGLEVIKTKSLKGIPALAAKVAVDQAGKGPLWDKVASGARIIPGLGATTSAGMAGAVALGRRLGVQNMAMAAARSALPSSTMQVAFDAGIGIAQGKRLDADAFKIVREQLPRGSAAQAAFNTGLAIARGKGGSETLQALQASLPSGALGQHLSRVAATALKQRAVSTDANRAMQAASSVIERLRSQDPAAQAALKRVLASAAKGDASARVATRLLRKALAKSPTLVTSRDALRSAQAAPGLAEPGDNWAPQEAEGVERYESTPGLVPLDGTEALIQSMAPTASAGGCSCSH